MENCSEKNCQSKLEEMAEGGVTGGGGGGGVRESGEDAYCFLPFA